MRPALRQEAASDECGQPSMPFNVRTNIRKIAQSVRPRQASV